MLDLVAASLDGVRGTSSTPQPPPRASALATSGWQREQRASAGRLLHTQERKCARERGGSALCHKRTLVHIRHHRPDTVVAGSEETWSSDGLSWLVVGRRGLVHSQAPDCQIVDLDLAKMQCGGRPARLTAARWQASQSSEGKRAPRQVHPWPPPVCAPAAIPTRVAVNLASSLCALTY
jgi:hypothetical protein